MSKIKHRLIFEADFSYLSPDIITLAEIEQEYSHVITDDEYIMSRSQSRIVEITKFIVACIYLAKSAGTEISIDVTEEREELTVFLASKVIRFNVAGLVNLSHVCLSAINLTVLSGNEGSDKALVYINYNLSDDKRSFIERILG